MGRIVSPPGTTLRCSGLAAAARPLAPLAPQPWPCGWSERAARDPVCPGRRAQGLAERRRSLGARPPSTPLPPGTQPPRPPTCPAKPATWPSLPALPGAGRGSSPSDNLIVPSHHLRDTGHPSSPRGDKAGPPGLQASPAPVLSILRRPPHNGGLMNHNDCL